MDNQQNRHIAIFKLPLNGSIIGYAYLGEEFLWFHRSYPNIPFSFLEISVVDSLSTLVRLSEKAINGSPALREALEEIDKGFAPAATEPAMSPAERIFLEIFTKKLAEATREGNKK